MAVTKRKPLPPLEASRSEQDAYARLSHGLQSTGVNQGAATRNRMTPPVTVAPTAPVGPGTAPANGNPSMEGTVQTPSVPAILSASVLDIGQCKPGDQVSFSVLSIQEGQISLGNPLVLPGTPQGTTQ